MQFTFGIITNGKNDSRIEQILNSIERLNINDSDYEIIIVGNSNLDRKNMSVISFDENTKSLWITRKKNIITEEANFDNIVYLHDYIIFDENWYKNFVIFGNNFDICMNQILNTTEDRYRDWTLWAEDANKLGISNYLLPYEETRLSKFMYISGAYWVAKKRIMEEFPLNENLIWGYGEDVEWSKRVREKYNFSINKNSIVKLIKFKERIFNFITNNEYENLKNKLNLK